MYWKQAPQALDATPVQALSGAPKDAAEMMRQAASKAYPFSLAKS